MLVARPIGSEAVFVADRDPTATDDFETIGARVGNRWVRQATGEWWKCRVELTGQAVWDRDTLGVAGVLKNLTRGALVYPLASFGATSLVVNGAIVFRAPAVENQIWHRFKVSGLYWETLAGGASKLNQQFFPGPTNFVARNCKPPTPRSSWRLFVGTNAEPLVQEILFGINTWPGPAQLHAPRSIDLNVQFLRRGALEVEWASKQTLSPTTLKVSCGVDLTGRAVVVLGDATTAWVMPNFEITQAELVGQPTEDYKLKWTASAETSLSGWTLVEAT